MAAASALSPIGVEKRILASLDDMVKKPEFSSREEHFPIDPMIAVAQFAYLGQTYKSGQMSGVCKFAFRHHSIIFNKEETTIAHALNGFGRYWNGDNRDDVDILMPLFKQSAYIFKPHENNAVKAIFIAAAEGLKYLSRVTYKDDVLIAGKIKERVTELGDFCSNGVVGMPPFNEETLKVIELWGQHEVNLLCNLLKLKIEEESKVEAAGAGEDAPDDSGDVEAPTPTVTEGNGAPGAGVAAAASKDIATVERQLEGEDLINTKGYENFIKTQIKKFSEIHQIFTRRANLYLIRVKDE